IPNRDCKTSTAVRLTIRPYAPSRIPSRATPPSVRRSAGRWRGPLVTKAAPERGARELGGETRRIQAEGTAWLGHEGGGPVAPVGPANADGAGCDRIQLERPGAADIGVLMHVDGAPALRPELSERDQESGSLVGPGREIHDPDVLDRLVRGVGLDVQSGR